MISPITKAAYATEELAPCDRGPQAQLWPAEFARVFLLWEAKASSVGIETGTIKERSSGIVPFWMACTSVSRAAPAFGGTKIVAASKPRRTQVCPLFGRPSHPIYGNFNQCSRASRFSYS